MVQRRFYNISEIASIFGMTVSAVHGHLARKQFDAVPPPMKLGRRLAWLVESVDDWIEAKAAQAVAQAENYQAFMQTPAKPRGRPTKAETRAREKTASLSEYFVLCLPTHR